MEKSNRSGRHFVLVAVAAAAILSGCTGTPQSVTNLPYTPNNGSAKSPSQHGKHVKPADQGQFNKDTVLSKNNHFADTLLIVGAKNVYFFDKSGRRVTWDSPHLLVRAFNSLWTFRCSKIVQIRYLDQPTSKDIPCSSFPKEGNNALISALNAAVPTGSTICADCDFPVAFDFVTESPYSGEVLPTPPPVSSPSPTCNSGVCSGSAPIVNPTPPPAPFGLGSTSACPFPQAWIYSSTLQACLSPSDTIQKDTILLGMATSYVWSRGQQLTSMGFTTPCCVVCAYYDGSYCVEWVYPDDYYESYYLDWTGNHGSGSGWYTFCPYCTYAFDFSPTKTPYSDSLGVVWWAVGGYGIAAADGAKTVP